MTQCGWSNIKLSIRLITNITNGHVITCQSTQHLYMQSPVTTQEKLLENRGWREREWGGEREWEWGGGAHMGFPERSDAILIRSEQNWTEYKWWPVPYIATTFQQTKRHYYVLCSRVRFNEQMNTVIVIDGKMVIEHSRKANKMIIQKELCGVWIFKQAFFQKADVGPKEGKIGQKENLQFVRTSV